MIAWPTVPAVAPPLEAPLVELPSGTLTADQANVRGGALANLTGIPGDQRPGRLLGRAADRACSCRPPGAATSCCSTPPRRWSGPTAAAGSRRSPPLARRATGGLTCRRSSSRGCERAFGEVLAVQGIDLEVDEGEIYGFLGPNGAGKTTTVRMLTTLLLPTGGRASVAGHDVVAEARAGARLDRRRPAGSGARPADDRPRADPPAGDAAGAARPPRAAARRRPARAGRPRRRRRPPRRHLLGRDEAPARPRRRARPRTARPLPRRADHRPRPGQPQDDLGGGAGAERRRHHRLPHHPVPGGGRPARRQRRDHRQRPDRRRGHAGVAEGRDRQPPHRAAARRGLDRRGRARLRASSASCCRRRTARRSWSRSRTAPPTSPASSAPSTRPGSRSSRWSWSARPSTTSSSPRPATTSNARRDEERRRARSRRRRERPGRRARGWCGRWACARSARPSAARS